MPIEALAPLSADSAAFAAAPMNPAPDAGFAQRFADHLGEVSDQIDSAQAGLVRLATGETGNLHHVMLELSKARLAFQLTLELRNKLLEGYQDIMRMQL